MKRFELSDFSELLLKIYRLCEDRSIDEFQDASLELIKQVVAFDTSIWGTATMKTDGIDIHQIHLHRTSQEMLDAYELVKHEDTAALSVLQRGTATDGFHSKVHFARTECGEFLRRFEHENFFVAMETTRATNFLHWFSLYRVDPEAHCTNDERDLVEALRPHLMQALAINRGHHLHKNVNSFTGFKHGLAIADLRGVVYQSDPAFDGLLRQEWSNWNTPTLPQPLMDRLLGGSEQATGNSVVVAARAEHGLLFLSARPRCLADALTNRERVIARQIARGATHKEIAQTLVRSPATVRNQIQTIYAKLQVSSIAGLIEAMRPLQ
jgi:DNA-binding CsgD family transcriptional regulator